MFPSPLCFKTYQSSNVSVIIIFIHSVKVIIRSNCPRLLRKYKVKILNVIEISHFIENLMKRNCTNKIL